MRFVSVLVLPVLLFVASPAAQAALADPVGDFLPTYTFTKGPDLDVTSINVTFDGAAFHLTGTMAGAIGTTAGALYVWGLDRGKGTQRFQSGVPKIGAGVTFDSVLLLRPNGTGTFNDLIAGTSTALPTSDISISGDAITANLPLSFAPSQGRSPDAYGFNLWPRLGAGNNAQISDFAPDASDITATVPEPGSLALLVMGLAGWLGLTRRRLPRRA